MNALKNTIHYRYHKHKKFLFYSIIGVSGVVLDLIVFIILSNYFNIDTKIATAVSVTIGITNNFILNTTLNFRLKDKLLKRFISFYLVGWIGLGISEIMLFTMSDVLKLNSNFVKISSIFVIVAVQYNLNKFISFGQEQNAK